MSEVTHDPQQDYINSLEQQCAALTQRWSPEKPTKPGWYWRRNLSWPNGYIIELDQDELNGMVRHGWYSDGEWAGPLEVPQWTR